LNGLALRKLPGTFSGNAGGMNNQLAALAYMIFWGECLLYSHYHRTVEVYFTGAICQWKSPERASGEDLGPLKSM